MKDKRDYESLPLGKSVDYPEHYDPSQLQAISRALGRRQLPEALPMRGSDLWNAYELSWLNDKGQPQVACGQFRFRADSPNMVESKSLKLYLNSLNQTRFESVGAVQATLSEDLSAVAGSPIESTLFLPSQWQSQFSVAAPQGQLLDEFDVGQASQQPTPELLAFSDIRGSKRYYTNLFRSRCPVTGQPDWATVEIEIEGCQPSPESLLSYLIAFRDNDEFHQQCVERIFADLYQQGRPDSLTVYARYTRRGGLDINPLRSTNEDSQPFVRLPRQ